jgi:hypothetical protein
MHHSFNVLVLNILLHVLAFQNAIIRESDTNMLRCAQCRGKQRRMGAVYCDRRCLSQYTAPKILSSLILHPRAYEDGTDKVFRNVGYWTPYAGEQPKRLHTIYRTRRKLEIKVHFLSFIQKIPIKVRSNEWVTAVSGHLEEENLLHLLGFRTPTIQPIT